MISFHKHFCFLLYLVNVHSSINPFDDTILYSIRWPGKNNDVNELSDAIEGTNDLQNAVIGVTDKREKYICSLPSLEETEQDSNSPYTGPNPLELLSPLFIQTQCTYRLESYWTYEICHGRYVKQYHEERDSKKIKKQEYYLGRWDLTMQSESSKQLLNAENSKQSIKTKKIEGMDVPYFQLNYTDGTLCDLNERPRQTNVLYMCFDHGRLDIYSIKEISTCLYEAIIFTPLLCKHPLYKPKNSGEKSINCIPTGGSPKKPANLREMEAESFKLRHEQYLDKEQAMKKVLAVFSVDKTDGQEGEPRLHVQIHPLDTLNDLNVPILESSIKQSKSLDMSGEITSFLSGENCFRGKRGWWNFEFCYGKHITQYHEETDSSKITNDLGKFNLEEHKKWLRNNPSKRPKKNGNTVSHFYSMGSFCEKIKAPRETEVRFKCVKGSNVTPSSIALYLEEPNICKYVLYMDSPLICQMIPTIDEFGLFDETKLTRESVAEHDEL